MKKRKKKIKNIKERTRIRCTTCGEEISIDEFIDISKKLEISGCKRCGSKYWSVGYF